jgi:hypothetical protein
MIKAVAVLPLLVRTAAVRSVRSTRSFPPELPPRSINHQNSQFWSWAGPRNWTSADGANGIFIQSGNGLLSLDYGFSTVLCSPGADARLPRGPTSRSNGLPCGQVAAGLVATGAGRHLPDPTVAAERDTARSTSGRAWWPRDVPAGGSSSRGSRSTTRWPRARRTVQGAASPKSHPPRACDVQCAGWDPSRTPGLLRTPVHPPN